MTGSIASPSPSTGQDENVMGFGWNQNGVSSPAAEIIHCVIIVEMKTIIMDFVLTYAIYNKEASNKTLQNTEKDIFHIME